MPRAKKIQSNVILPKTTVKIQITRQGTTGVMEIFFRKRAKDVGETSWEIRYPLTQ